MKTGIKPHTVTFGRWKTSISLEDTFWIGLIIAALGAVAFLIARGRRPSGEPSIV